MTRIQLTVETSDPKVYGVDSGEAREPEDNALPTPFSGTAIVKRKHFEFSIPDDCRVKGWDYIK
jgi:hypothetical protein